MYVGLFAFVVFFCDLTPNAGKGEPVLQHSCKT